MYFYEHTYIYIYICLFRYLFFSISYIISTHILIIYICMLWATQLNLVDCIIDFLEMVFLTVPRFRTPPSTTSWR